MLLLRHAAAKTDEDLRPAGFQVGELPHVSENLHFGVFPDGTGVIEDQVSLGGLFGEAEAHLRQHSHDPLAVGGVLLAAVAANQRQKGVTLAEVLSQRFRTLGKIFPLLLGLLRWEEDGRTGVGMNLLRQNGTSKNGQNALFAAMPDADISCLFYHFPLENTRTIL